MFTLYNFIPHVELKDRLHLLITQTAKREIVMHSYISYFVKNHIDYHNKYTGNNIINVLDFLIYNMFVDFGGLMIYQQLVGVHKALIIQHYWQTCFVLIWIKIHIQNTITMSLYTYLFLFKIFILQVNQCLCVALVCLFHIDINIGSINDLLSP